MMRLHYAAISDVGRVRKDNQDSGYAGPWLLAVCDGVGGAARGDIASATAIGQLRRLDEPVDETVEADPEGLLAQVAGALHRAHDGIADLVEEEPALMGTSTCATLARFDGREVAIGHVGDSRAYLLRNGALSQLTRDHTFVQSLIDEGRLTEADARVHPHRNVILQALDGATELDPDLFVVPLEPGDRLFLCSDGACGYLDDDQLAVLLSDGTPEYAAVELTRASLEAGSTDNVTCIVADVLDEAAAADQADVLDALEPQLVGSAAELRRRLPRGSRGAGFFRHRPTEAADAESSDLPEHAITSDPLDPEAARYAPREPLRFHWLRLAFIGLAVIGLIWVASAAAWSWSQQQYYVGEHDGFVAIYRGVNTDLPGLVLSHAYESSDLAISDLCTFEADQVRSGLDAGSLSDARTIITGLAADASPSECPTS